MLTCFSVSNSIGLTATPLYTIEHSGRANNSIVNAVDSMEFYMAGSTSGLGRRPLKAETHVRIVRESPYGCLDKGKSPASQAGGGGSYATSNHHLPITQSALCKILTIHASGSAVRCVPTEQ